MMLQTDSERYMAFLQAELPRLAANPLPKSYVRPWRRHHARRCAVMLHALSGIANPGATGLFLEFGVYKGGSLRLSAKAKKHCHFFGFDSFEGFPDDGRSDWRQDFSTRMLPQVPDNVTLVKGWFNDSLPRFLEEHLKPVSYLHIDCDLYSSTRQILSTLHQADRLMPGTVICFDELINYPDYLWNEMLALFEFLEISKFGIEWLGTRDKVYRLDDTIAMLEADSYPTWEMSRGDGYFEQAALVLTDGLGSSPADGSDMAETRKLAVRYDALTNLRLRPAAD